MEDGFFLNGGSPPPPPLLYTASSWNSSSDCDVNPSCDDRYPQFEPAMASSPAASAIREMIGKFGNVCSSSPSLVAATAGGCYSGNSEVTVDASCFTAHFNSHPELLHMTGLANSLPLNAPHLPALYADPGFADRAAKFSRFGSRSFNGKKSQLGLNSNSKKPYRSTTMSRVSSTPALKQAGSPLQNQNFEARAKQLPPAPGSDHKLGGFNGAHTNSNDSSSVLEQVPSGSTSPGDLNSRKRKAAARGKLMEETTNSSKVVDTDTNSSSKRSKLMQGNANESSGTIITGTDDIPEDDIQKKSKANQKPPEPPKDYIHVRARRGQATDSHSLAERVRREKISERMKLLQDLVPGCNKITGKALMLDEIINYVQSLQRQVEFLSMKLACVNPAMEINNDNLIPKDICHLESFPPTFHGMHQHLQIPQEHNNVSSGAVSQCKVLDGFGETLSQFCDDDLQSVVQMGINQTTL